MATTPKKLLSTHSAPNRHWVGDGFPVHGMFGYTGDTKRISPFLMLDYAAPWADVPAGRTHAHFAEYPEESIADWHRKRGLAVA